MKLNKRNTRILLALAVLLLVTLACATANPSKGVALEATGEVYGFWNGLWDGWTAGIAWLFNLFGGHYGIYEVHNNGNWYDFGFLLGVGAFASGSSTAASSRRNK
ncbi:MAG: hypothetical protein ACD_19C00187G0010 [uncultured bacterium]|nr:MAG: hypothetical protein ACD_19C00187G0010 [uncultured bacterium]